MRLHWLASELQGFSCPHVPSTVNKVCATTSGMGSGDYAQIIMLLMQTLYQLSNAPGLTPWISMQRGMVLSLYHHTCVYALIGKGLNHS